MTLRFWQNGVALPDPWSNLLRYFGIAFQLGLLLLIVREFQLESQAFMYLVMIALIGFMIHTHLPIRFRLPFFALLSLVGILMVLGMSAGLWLIGLGLVLIMICHIPIPFWARVVTLLVVGGGLVLVRMELLPSPWSGAIWPILGSMFMFRLIVYLYDLKHSKTPPGIASSLAYFFLLPNVAFPLFPVVDFRTFQRSHYSEKDEYKTYQRGIEWMFRGIVHLILYRFVYYYLTISPGEVQTTGDLVRFLVSNYALYLRISGHFHMIIGMLHLFGFHLPETNHLYFLASSFTDYWRRINIYWKDFMLKIFYYPSFFWFRRFGQTTALILATLLVFAVTALLHSYQWFWIRGSFPLQLQDTMFWSILAVLVTANALYEAKKGRKRSLKGTTWSPRDLPVKALKTAGTFAIICVLWSLWTSSSVTEWLSLWSVWDLNVAFDARTLAPMALVMAVTIGMGAPNSDNAPKGGNVFTRLLALRRSAFITAVSIVGVYAIAQPAVYRQFTSPVAETIHSLQQRRLSVRDRSLLERGYYENLLGVDRFNTELWTLYAKQPDDWVNLWQTDAVRWTGDLLRLELRPNVTMTFKGKQFSTNQWGLRDRPYDQVKPADTYRIALLGSSPIMGSGVGDNETLDWYLEERLNSSSANGAHGRYEVLNFAVDGYTVLQQVMVLEEKVVDFDADVVLYIAHETEAEKTVGQLATLISERTEIPFAELRDIAQRAGVEPGTNRNVGARRLRPYGDEILAWAYRRLGELAAKQGTEFRWTFMPMPAVGEGSPCQESASLCFGSIATPGQAANRNDPRVAQLFAIAEAANLEHLDLSAAYDGYDLQSLWVAEWDNHPNAKGNELAADKLHQLIHKMGKG